MLHLRVIAPADTSAAVVEALRTSPAVTHLTVVPGAAKEPPGDLVECDVAREGANDVLTALRDLGVVERGGIVVEPLTVTLSDAARRASRRAPGIGVDAVVWEEVEQKTGQDTRLSATYLLLLSVATIIAGIGVLLDQPILIVGAMVVGPEFGPLAALSVALVERRRDLARRSLAALGVGFPVGMLLTFATVLLFRAVDVAPDEFIPDNHPLTEFISEPDFFSFFVAYVAGTAGILSLTNAKSGALIGVLISVTTIPAASYVATAFAYGEPDDATAAAAQLGINLFAIVLAGVLTLYVQRRLYVRRRREHLMDPARAAAGLPVGRSARKEHGGR